MFSDIQVDAHRCQLQEVEGVVLVVINALLCIVGTVGNMLVCSTILLTPSLHTLSSYCIFNLSCADLLVCCIVEPSLVYILSWKLHGVCMVEAEYAARLVGNLSCGISILTLATMSIERCCAIAKPMTYKCIITTTRLKCFLVFGWFLGCTTPALDAFVDEPRKQTYVQFTLIGMVFLYCIILVCYAFLFKTVRNQSRQQRELRQTRDVSHEAEKKLAKTVALVIGFFTICWFPFAVRLVLKPSKNYGSEYIWAVTASLANSIVNPILYFYRNYTFRNALKSLLKKNCFMEKQRIGIGISASLNSLTTATTMTSLHVLGVKTTETKHQVIAMDPR